MQTNDIKQFELYGPDGGQRLVVSATDSMIEQMNRRMRGGYVWVPVLGPTKKFVEPKLLPIRKSLPPTISKREE